MSSEDKQSLNFNYGMTHSVLSGANTFPLALSTASASGPKRAREGSNNQDSVCIHVDTNYLIGVVCDGCGSPHKAFESHSTSSNEIGAKLTSSYVVAQLRSKLDSKKRFVPDKLIGKLSKDLLRTFNSTVKAFCGKDQDTREKFIFDFLMTTVIGFIVTEEQFLVFYVGDGIIGIDGDFLDLESEAGTYFANDLLSICCPKKFATKNLFAPIKIYKSGPTSELKSLFIGSDGFSPFLRSYPGELTSLLGTPADINKCTLGFEFSLPEFRRNISSNPNIRSNFNDDAAFIMLRRFSNL